MLPPKCEDPGIFSIPISIGRIKIDRAMLDPSASINVIPSYLVDIIPCDFIIYVQYVIQLVDGSEVELIGKIYDREVSVGDLTFRTTFQILKRDDEGLYVKCQFIRTTVLGIRQCYYQ